MSEPPVEQAVQLARHDEQIKTLFNYVRVMIFLQLTQVILMTLALIYGALGNKGFNAVAREAPNIVKGAVR